MLWRTQDSVSTNIWTLTGSAGLSLKAYCGIIQCDAINHSNNGVKTAGHAWFLGLSFTKFIAVFKSRLVVGRESLCTLRLRGKKQHLWWVMFHVYCKQLNFSVPQSKDCCCDTSSSVLTMVDHFPVNLQLEVGLGACCLGCFYNGRDLK